MVVKRVASIIFLLIIVFEQSYAVDFFEQYRKSWIQKAVDSTPKLHETIVRPVSMVTAIADKNAFQGWKYLKKDGLEDLPKLNYKEVRELTFDFGMHVTGYFSFSTRIIRRCQDAPVRFRLTFGELPAEINTPLEPWKGTLSRAWMQDEIITLDMIGNAYTLPRRMAFRYVKVELLGASSDFDFAISDVTCKAVSSAGRVQTTLLRTCPPDIANINKVSVATLGECMQTVYEDGPKRDRRLWAGDMYLESLANRYSYKNFNLTKHCLYIFAALTDSLGRVLSNCFEWPYYHAQPDSYCLNYSLLWTSTLLEYLKDTGDIATANDLWPVALRQIELALQSVGKDYVYHPAQWLFFVHKAALDCSASAHAAVLFGLRQTCELANMLRRDKEVFVYLSFISRMEQVALANFYDELDGIFVSGPQRQVSVLSQAWMILGGVVKGKLAQRALRSSLDKPDSFQPATPYAMHFVLQAMLDCGMKKEARQLLVSYWGGMVEKGADTFWEVYDPTDDTYSPYHFFPLNSACHAWSCTPVYFIHNYADVFQE